MRPILLALLILGACSSTPSSSPSSADQPAPTASEADAAQTTLETGLGDLRVAIQQQQDPGLWSEVLGNGESARETMDSALEQGANARTCEAGLVTADGLATWHTLYLDSLDINASDLVAALKDETLALRLGELTASLDGVLGRVAETSLLLTDIHFQSGNAEAGAAVLGAGLDQWPGDDDLHESARAWRDAIPAPDALITVLDEAMAARPGDGGLKARCLHTRAFLNLSMGGTDYFGGDLASAADRYTASARDFQSAYTAQLTLSENDADLLSAQAYTYAGWSHYNLADAALTEGDKEVALEQLTAAERSFSDALGRVADDEEGIRGLNFVGDFHVNPQKLDDMEAGREFFGRIARRHDSALWWNNHAFFSRETGMYDDSYAAYERCIALEPDNARYVNDTALIPVYYSEEMETFDDTMWGRVEELLMRAWELGKDVCDNPFVSEEAYTQNFEAYGDAMLNLARLYLMQDRLDEAQETIDELVEIAPARIDAQQMRAAILMAKRMEEEEEEPAASDAEQVPAGEQDQESR